MGLAEKYFVYPKREGITISSSNKCNYVIKRYTVKFTCRKFDFFFQDISITGPKVFILFHMGNQPCVESMSGSHMTKISGTTSLSLAKTNDKIGDFLLMKLKQLTFYKFIFKISWSKEGGKLQNVFEFLKKCSQFYFLIEFWYFDQGYSYWKIFSQNLWKLVKVFLTFFFCGMGASAILSEVVCPSFLYT